MAKEEKATRPAWRSHDMVPVVRTPDQDAVSKLCVALARDTKKADLRRTGCRTLAGIINRDVVRLHDTLIDKICSGQRSVSPATKQAIVDGLSAEINRLKKLRSEFKKAIK